MAWIVDLQRRRQALEATRSVDRLDQRASAATAELGGGNLCRSEAVLRHGRDYYVKHDKPKRLFVRELCGNARRSLQAEHLKADLARVEAKVPVRCSLPVKEIESIAHQFRQVPEYRDRY